MLLLEDLHPLDRRFFPVQAGQELVVTGENGEPDLVVCNLQELSQAIQALYYGNKESFARHVNADRNLFADWLETAYGEEKVAAWMRFRPDPNTAQTAIQKLMRVDIAMMEANRDRIPFFKGAPAIEVARVIFEKEGLQFPPIPTPFDEQFQLYGSWFFGTRYDLPASPYMGIQRFIEEFEQGHAPDYLIVLHDGHGFNSWGMHFYLVQGPLGIFLQLPWGGVYTNAEIASEQIAHCLDSAQRLINAAREATLRGQLTPATLVTLVISFRLLNRATWPGGENSRFDLSPGSASVIQVVDRMVDAIASLPTDSTAG